LVVLHYLVDVISRSTKSLSEKWLPAVTFTIRNMQNLNGYFAIIFDIFDIFDIIFDIIDLL
jgi:hypothetical protein